MCDTIIASPDCTGDHVMLFGKDSDRQRNEAQTVELLPGADYPTGAQLTCTYITIPQARRTHGVLVCRPFWIWGAEMGANEHGVVIGNEALHARSPAPETPALTGMDLLRLGLERAATAAEALEVITGLLEQHGQGGNCGHLSPSYYNNGFMIADAREAFVLETIDREWLVERVHSMRAISNQYSIGQEVERTSSGLSGLLRGFGWSGEASPNHAEIIADPRTAHIGSARGRRQRATALLEVDRGRLRVADLMRILRDHDPRGDCESGWDPRHRLEYSLCIHAGPSDRMGQTTGAMVSEIRSRDPVHWVTGTAAPCLSIFKPVLMDVPLPERGPLPTERFDSRVLWWRHERLHRTALMQGFAEFLESIRQERNALEAEFQSRVSTVLQGGSVPERARVIADCWREAIVTEDRWLARLERKTLRNDSPYDVAWTEMSRLAGLDA